MNNKEKIYLLDKTCVGINGQVKWMLKVDDGEITDFQLSPLHSSIPSYYRKDLMNYSHVENLKILYNSIKDSFFLPLTQVSSLYPRYNTERPIWEDQYTRRVYRNRTQMFGWNKSFSALFPIYLTLKTIDDLKFIIKVKDLEKGNLINTKSISLNDRMKDYINSFINDTELFKEDIMYINFEEGSAFLKGVDVSKGLCMKKDVSRLIPNLLSIERPMMEMDNMVSRLWEEEKTIIPNFFNFNLCFNIDDLLPRRVYQYIKYKKVGVEMEVMVGDKTVEKRNLYSNYDFIPRFSIKKGDYMEEKDGDVANALTYLMDHKQINLIDKNKILPNTFHWCLRENEDYMFNLYDGMSPLYEIEGGETCEGKGIYTYQPTPWDDIYLPWHNPIYWCRVSKVEGGEDSKDTMRRINEVWNNEDNFSMWNKKDNDKDEIWWGLTKINNKELSKEVEGVDEIKIGMVQLKNCVYDLTEIKDAIGVRNFVERDGVVFWFYNERNTKNYKGLFILTDSVDSVDKNNNYTYDSFLIRNIQEKGLTHLFTVSGDIIILQTIMGVIQKALNHIIYPTVIQFNDRLTYTPSDSPSVSSKEVEYEKLPNNGDRYVIRYSGNIIPYMVKEEDKKHFNFEYCNIKSKNYNLYSQTEFKPLYPSIQYNSIGIIEDEDRKKEKKNQELFWKDINECIILPMELDITYEGTTLTENKKKELLLSQIGWEGKNEEEYIYGLYDKSYTFEYKSLTDIKHYIYKIKYRLK